MFSSDGTATITALADGASVKVYSLTGLEIAGGVVKNGSVSIDLSSVLGQVVVVKVGNRAAKYMVK